MLNQRENVLDLQEQERDLLVSPFYLELQWNL